MNEKRYYVTSNVGRVKYLLNTHNGVDKHADGSPFFACECFSNKKKLAARIKELESEGYREGRQVSYKETRTTIYYENGTEKTIVSN